MRKGMEPFVRSLGLAAALSVFTSGVALAAPIKGTISVMPALPFQAAELKLSSHDIPVGLSGQAMTMFGQSHWLSVWGDLRHALSESASIGLHAGLNQSWVTLGSYPAGTPVTPRLGPLRYLVGTSYHHQFGSASLRVNPTLVFVDFSTLNHLESLVIGPPLLEVGYRFTPSFEMGIRTSVTPLSASWVF